MQLIPLFFFSLLTVTCLAKHSSSDDSSSESWDLSGSSTGASKRVQKYCKKRGQIAYTFKGDLKKPLYRIAKVLNKSEIEATFFVNGRDFSKRVSKKKYLFNKKVLAGLLSLNHVVGLVPWEEKSQWKKNGAKRVLRSVQRSAYYLTKVLGFRPNFVHPPKGTIPKSAIKILGKYGFHVISWNTTLEKNGTKLPKYKHKGSAKKHSFIAYQHGDKDTSKSTKKTIKNVEKRDYDAVSLQNCIDLLPYAKPHRYTARR